MPSAVKKAATKVNNIAPALSGLAVDIDLLVLDPMNARIHPEQSLDAIRKSLVAYGQLKPVVVRRDTMTVVAGNGMVESARSLGWTKVAANVLDMTDAEAAGYGLADNRVAEMSHWDYEVVAKLRALHAEVSECQEGWTAEEIERLRLTSWTPTAGADDLPDDKDVVPITQPGDVWILGEHRVMCGDATLEEDVHKLLQGVVPPLMVTDPPYGVNYDPEWRNNALRSNGTPSDGRAIGIVHGDVDASWEPAYQLFLGQVAYVWHADRHATTVHQDLVKCGFDIINQIIWGKNNFAIGRGNYHWRHEPCWYAVRKGMNHNWQGSRSEDTLWEIPKPQKSETGHSAQKPVECMSRPIRNNSRPKQAVYDPFLGSGTTVIAAQELGRRCFGMEISPEYVDLSVQRWANFTGLDPVRESDGRTLSELKQKPTGLVRPVGATLPVVGVGTSSRQQLSGPKR